MDYHLEREIRLNNKSEHEGLYKWSLEEFDSDGDKVGSDQIPWNWSFHFSISELRLIQGVEFGELSFFEDEEDEPNKEEQKLEESEAILATLHPGYCTDGKWLENDTRFSMFGTNRTISDFSLRIYKVEKEEDEHCSIWGGVSCTSEIDFRDETSPDSIELQLALSADRFDKLAGLISRKEIDVARMSLSRVSGFYSEWSPSISTSRVKVLARGREQEIIKPDECDIEPPRLGEVEKFDLTLITRCKLNPKQDFTTLNISKLFDKEEVYEEESEEPEDITKTLLVKIALNQAEIIKLKTPLWIAVVLLGLLVLGKWY